MYENISIILRQILRYGHIEWGWQTQKSNRKRIERCFLRFALHIKNKIVTKDVTKEISERQRIILDLIKENKNITIPEISQRTNVTERTVKRDIASLQELG